ncbi:sigma-70 family RNA polymerase sigma factor [Oculatella sp. LEGE 06141]|uniref:sigma-70 family RNA polymerase sigma factor n=1 Tax=Oculatella sp. LEGE 06141 TaxID=1828648 RepID=UPI001882846F|nr:sigma-70 family RNA polymerase sigma factor [Oculatella sp. LEGE 06141]MBE9177229.1 sigma-70 family RNA polymerase sigma factor [Oculatella sp. LEGE 06141]
MHSDSPGNQPRSLLQQTDAELFVSLKAGRTGALGILYDRHSALVYGLALKTLGNPQEAEDLTQDIFVTLWRSSSYDPSRGSLRTFLAIMTRSRAIDRVRSRTAAQHRLEQWHPRRSEDVTANLPFEQVAQGERSQEVQAALAQLSNSQQQILKMAYYEGLSQSEIAKQLAIPLGTVKARARRGLLKLRQTLADVLS